MCWEGYFFIIEFVYDVKYGFLFDVYFMIIRRVLVSVKFRLETLKIRFFIEL